MIDRPTSIRSPAHARRAARHTVVLHLLMLALAVAVLAPPVARAQTNAAPARVGYLGAGSAPAGDRFNAGEQIFFERLRELGWIEGQNLVIELRRAQGKAEVLPALAAELVQRRVDVIVTAGTTAVSAAREITQTVPIVMAGAGDPVATGLVKSLVRPGGNVTGISQLGQEIVPKSLSLLREVAPGLKRVDLLANAANPANAFFMRMMAEAAKPMGIETRLIEVRTPDEIEPAIANTPAAALLVLADPMFYPHAGRIAQAAAKRRIPLGSTGGRDYVKAGILMSYSVSQPELYRRAADYVDRILKGANPAEMPVEQPTRYLYLINLKTAKALGLAIPQSLLLRADEVIR